MKMKSLLAKILCIIGFVLLFFSPLASPASAHINPAGCSGNGLGIDLYAYPAPTYVGNIISYDLNVFNGSNRGPIACDAANIQATLITPDSQSHTIPLTRTSLANGQLDSYPGVVTYTARTQDIQADGTLLATARVVGDIHQADTDSQGGSSQGVNTQVLTACNAPLDKDQFRQALASGQIATSSVVIDNNLNQASTALTNNTNCPVQVSLSSYKVFSLIRDPQWLSKQQFFHGTNLVTVQAGETKTLTVNTADCQTQVDLWYGLYPANLLDSNPYFYPNSPFIIGYNFSPKNICATATITVVKTVINDNGGTKAVADFPLFVDGVRVSSGAAHPISPGSHAISETADSSYSSLIGGDCASDGTIALLPGDVKTCVITNNDVPGAIITPPPPSGGGGGAVIMPGPPTMVANLPIIKPLIHLTKVPSQLTLPVGGGLVAYTFKITNPGIIPLSNLRLADDKCSPVNYVSGDANGDGKLDPSETFTYTCQANLTETTTNLAMADGQANGLTMRSVAMATVVVTAPRQVLGVKITNFPNAGLAPDERSAWTKMIALYIVFILILISLAVVMLRRVMKSLNNNLVQAKPLSYAPEFKDKTKMNSLRYAIKALIKY